LLFAFVGGLYGYFIKKIDPSPLAGMTPDQIRKAGDRVKQAKPKNPIPVAPDPDEIKARPWITLLPELPLADGERRLCFTLANRFGFTDIAIGEGLSGKAKTNVRERWLTIKNLIKIARGDEAIILQVAEDYFAGPYQDGFAFTSPDSLRNTLCQHMRRLDAANNAASLDEAEAKSNATQYKEVRTPLGIIFEEI
jgi:hypothetical protein